MAAVPEIEYSVRRSDRSKRVRVAVDPDRGVEVILPRRASMKAAEAAVVELRPWIIRRLREVEATKAHVLARGSTVPYLGSTLTLMPERGRTRVHRRGDTLLVPEGDPKDALERWYRRQAKLVVGPKLDHAVTKLGTRYTALTIRNQKTRWGSCSSTGAMSFNWRLLLAPEEVLDYVVWHEACHLRVMDHSPRFWKLVAWGYPGYEGPQKWLRRYGGTLVL
jgi:predicted metal-dependent hydrolase